MSARASQDVCLQADDLYRGRQNLSNVIESISLLSGLSDSMSTFEAKWRLSRALFFVGQEDTDREKKSVYFRDGVVAGRDAIHKEPARVEGHFWLGVNLGLLAESVGSFRALPIVQSAIKHLKQAINEGKKGNADKAMTHAEAAMTHLKQAE